MLAELSLTEFYGLLRHNFSGVSEVEDTNVAALRLEFDSIDILRLLILIDELTETFVPDLDPPSLYTVGDAFSYYQRQFVLAKSDKA